MHWTAVFFSFKHLVPFNVVQFEASVIAIWIQVNNMSMIISMIIYNTDYILYKYPSYLCH